MSYKKGNKMDHQQENNKNTNSTKKNSEIHTIGSFLKKERERQEIPLKIISRTTKISTTLLEYLENNKLDQLPNKAYVTGFVKSYCKSLSINEKKCLELLDQTYVSLFPHKKMEGLDKKFSPDSSSSNSAKSTFIFLFIVVGSLTGYLFNGKENIQRENSLETISHQSLNIKTPLQEAQDEVKIAQDAISKKSTLPMPNLAESSKVEIKKEKLESIKLSKKEEKNKKRKYNFLPIKGKLFSFQKNPSSEELKFLPIQIKKDQSPQKVFIKAVDGETWITFKTDQKPIKQLFLKKDKSLFIKGKEIRLFLGNINATKIFINDKLITYTSRTGVKSLVVPEKNNGKYHLPLFVFEKNGLARTSDEIIKESL